MQKTNQPVITDSLSRLIVTYTEMPNAARRLHDEWPLLAALLDEVAAAPAPSGMAHPSQRVVEWINLAVKYVEASSGVGCRECSGGIPSDAAKRGHDHHPMDCKGSLERCFGAYDVQTFLTQPAECWSTQRVNTP